MPHQDYQAGICNINQIEIKKRLTSAWLALIIFLIGLIYLLFFVNNKDFRLILIFPIFISILSFIQSQQKFCVFYGLSSLENAGKNSLKAKKISNEANRIKDHKKSRKLIGLSLLLSIIIMAGVLMLPTLQ